MLTRRLAVLFLGIMLAHLVYADNGRRRHWSDGVYFPPQTTPPQTSINDYPAGEQTTNPWAAQGYDEQQLPTPESLGYPSVDYDPYQGSQERRLRADPQAIRRDGERQQRLTPPESLGYPSIDYDPYPGVDERRVRPYAGQTRAFSPPPAYSPGTGYRSGQYEREADRLPYQRSGPPEPYGREFGAGVYAPPWDAGLYGPFYGRRTYPWVGGNPYYDSYDLGFPFLPSW